MAFDAQPVPVRLEPVLGQELHHRSQVVWPGGVRVVVEETAFFVVLVGLIAQLASCERPFALSEARLASHDIVFLATLPAESKRQEYPLTPARDVLLPTQGDVALIGHLQRGIHCIATTDELVQAERKDGELCLRVRDVVPGKQTLLDRICATCHGYAGQFGQLAGCTITAGDADRRHATQATAVRLWLEAKRRLDPDGERVLAEGIVLVWRFALRIPDAVCKCSDEPYLCQILLWRCTPQRLPDHAFGFHLRAEQPGGDSRDLALLVGKASTLGQGRRGADALQIWIPAGLPDTPHEHGHVGALTPSVGVQFVEHQEL